jgi:signal transduction histidine kinase
MQQNGPVTRSLSAMRRELLRGDFWFSVLIFAMIGIFLVSLLGSVWSNVVLRKDVEKKAQVQDLKAMGAVLARAAEALMAADELSMLRRVLVEAGTEHELKLCRIVMPDGQVLADADPAGITLLQLPPSWIDEVSRATEQVNEDSARLTFPLVVPHRGSARLEIAAGLHDFPDGGLTPQTAQMAIACLALAGMLLVHRHARFRLRAIGAIHEILLAVTDENADLASLELDPRLGMEAGTWNKLLGERQSVQICRAIQHVKEAVHEKSDAAGELRAAFEAVPCGLLLLNERMEVKRANAVASTLLGKDQARMAHVNVAGLVADQRVVATIREVIANPALKREVITAERGAAAGALRFTICPIRHDGSHLALVAIEDVAGQKVAEVAMTNFLAKAADQLRTPLANIRVLLEHALEHCEHDPASANSNFLAIDEETQRLEQTMSELVSASQLQTGCFQVKAHDVHMDVLLQQAQADHESQARQKRIALELEMPPWLPALQADREKLALVLHNLLDNALKYTPDGGRVVVRAAVDRGRLTVAVTDTGIGMVAEDRQRVFEKFYRCNHPLAAEVKGSGLGLPIARDVARLHGGDVTVESEPGKGSTFTLTLPIVGEAGECEAVDAAVKARGVAS